MRTRLLNIWNSGMYGFCIGYVVGEVLTLSMQEGIQNGLATFAEQNSFLFFPPYSTTDISFNNALLSPEVLSSISNEILPLTLGIVSAMTGIVCATIWPTRTELSPEVSPALSPVEEQLILPENQLQTALDNSGYQGKIPNWCLDPIMQVVMDEPVTLLTTNCFKPGSTALSYNRSSIEIMINKSFQTKCPMTKEEFTGYVQNRELKQAIESWVSKTVEKQEKNNSGNKDYTQKTSPIDIPDYYLDPITEKLMDDPCLLITKDYSSARSYNRSTILEALQNPDTHPWFSKEDYKGHIPNRGLKESIEYWKTKVRTKLQKRGFEGNAVDFTVFGKYNKQNTVPAVNAICRSTEKAVVGVRK